MTGIVDEGHKGDRSSLVARDTPFDSLAKPTTIMPTDRNKS